MSETTATTTQAPQPVGSRYRSLDFWRGACLMMMATYHAYSPLPAYAVVGFFDAAAGFILIAGLVVGYGYRLHTPTDFRRQDRRIYRRAANIWLAHVGTVLVLLTALQAFPYTVGDIWPWSTLLDGELWPSLVKYASLVYQTRFLDILPMYCFFLVLAPAAVRLLARGQAHWVLLVSLGLWLTVQIGPGFPGLVQWASAGHLHPSAGAFDWMAWQVLFFGGTVIGFRAEPLLTRSRTARRILLTVCAAVVAVFLLLHHLPWWVHSPLASALIPEALVETLWPIQRDPLFKELTRKGILGPLVVVNFAAFAYLLWWIALRWPRLFRWRWLELVGRHSLSVFVFHFVYIFVACFYVDQISSFGWLAHSAYALSITASLTLPAYASAKVQDFRNGLPRQATQTA